VEGKPEAEQGADPELETALAAIREVAGDDLLKLEAGGRTLRIEVTPAVLRQVAQVLHDHAALRLTYPADLFATDTGDGILLTYRLWSMERGYTALLYVAVPYEACEVPSVVGIWPGMDWHERECFDMFGVVFEGHPRAHEPKKMRILLSEDWEGHPFRKDYVPRFTGDPLHGPQETN